MNDIADRAKQARLNQFINRLLYETQGGWRFTQDSPVLTNVWLAYAHAPRAPQKLILTLDRRQSAGRAAAELREMLGHMRKRLQSEEGGYQPKERFVRQRPRIAYIPGQISAELYFDEMLRLVLPLTPWWRRTLRLLDRAAASKYAMDGWANRWAGFPMIHQSTPQWDDLIDGLQLMRREIIAEASGAAPGSSNGNDSVRREKYLRRLPVSLLWMIRLVGVIGDAFSNDRALDIPEKLGDLRRRASTKKHIEVLLARDFLRRDIARHKPDDNANGPRPLSKGEKTEIDRIRQTVTRTFANLYANWTRKKDTKDQESDDAGTSIFYQPKGAYFWRAALNRPVELAVRTSTLTVKADAARVLFDISCQDISWAVIDSGIDGSHPAFRDSGQRAFEEQWQRAEEAKGNGDVDASQYPKLRDLPSRVVRTLDFTYLRELLDMEVIESVPDDTGKNSDQSLPPEVEKVQQRLRNKLADQFRQKFESERKPGEEKMDFGTRAAEEALDHLQQLKRRIKKGYDISWEDLEPLIDVKQPDPPENDHGTHVAGVLGADWIDEDLEDKEEKIPLGLRTRRLTGICPDIRLIDVRVFRDDGTTDEFELLAAIQYLRWLNSRAGYMVVQGANLSLSLLHQVRRYACGQTPICEECNEAAETGMVIVTAAGNRGFEMNHPDEISFNDGYRSSTITDPGNADGVITVGSTHRKRPHDYGVSFFSSRGPTGDGRLKPDLVAPGEKIDGPIPEEGMEAKDGTSMAAPHVSGAAALLMARHSELIGRPQRIKQILCETATDLRRERYFQGNGLLDILRALQSV